MVLFADLNEHDFSRIHAPIDDLEYAVGQPVVRLGEKSTLLPALKQWLPTRLLDRVLSKKFGLDGLK